MLLGNVNFSSVLLSSSSRADFGLEEEAIPSEEYGVVGGSVKDAFEEIPMPPPPPQVAPTERGGTPKREAVTHEVPTQKF